MMLDPNRPQAPVSILRPGQVPPPHAPEAEVAVLGAILVDQTAFSFAAEYVQPADFFHPAHQKIMEAMIHLFDQGRGIDPVMVINRLREKGELDSAGGPAYVSGLVSSAATISSVEHHSQIIRDKALVRAMISTASTVVSEGYSVEYDPKEYLDRAEAMLFKAGEARIHGEVKLLDDLLDDAMVRIDDVHNNHKATRGIPTGYTLLDSKLSGLQESDLIILAARPSMGKTSVALNLALNAALATPRRYVMFCSLEMAANQLADRLLAIRSGIEASRIRGGFCISSERNQLVEIRKSLADVPLYIDDSPKLGMLELRAKARRMKLQNKLDLVMIDYLQLMDPSDKRVSREQQISEISRSLKAMAKELNIPVLALSQLSRAPESRPGKDKRPILSDLRESGAIEQDADVVLFLYRPEYYNRDDKNEHPEERNLLEVIIAKQRNGPTGKIGLTFVSETMQVANRENAEFSND